MLYGCFASLFIHSKMDSDSLDNPMAVFLLASASGVKHLYEALCRF